ncbi:hypothetical protein GCM10010170_013780 [Dactylosporangium salmoneum]|uniref:Uncharacterized protein n=1 Tax=Dactylosporangium salmoneum TaxID=53361 RepID=A0ABP5SM65_9ACTN
MTQRRVGHADGGVDWDDAYAPAVFVRERADDLAGRFSRPDEDEVEVWIGAACAQSAVNHDGGSPVPAEEVDGDPRDAGREFPAVRRSVGSRHPDPVVRPR